MSKMRVLVVAMVMVVVVMAGTVKSDADPRVPPPYIHIAAPFLLINSSIDDNGDNHVILPPPTADDKADNQGSVSLSGWLPPVDTLGSDGDWRTRLFRRDPLELSGMEEGDIVPHPTSGIKESGLQNKMAVRDDIKLWSGGKVPYEFSFEYALFPVEQLTIRRVMRDIAKNSCIRFVERTDEDDYLKIIVDRDRCYSHVGRVGGEQQLSLGLLCATFLDVGPIYHELLHALGLYHEHNRPDRDSHVDVNWDNIAEGSVKNFIKRDITSVELLDLPYDIDSVMHYSPFTFSKWSFLTPTLWSKEKGYSFWRKEKPSKTDYKKVNRLYGCQRGRRGRWLGRAGPPFGVGHFGHPFNRRQPGIWKPQAHS
ncbi:astacin-like metalloprotease toxin 2 [Eriocheir sinensis]|uniref:astacin-like metalloprotease toxin 2 n=1 Tax=Eriocheir sinensis TaxID=95602 RepID=UPI0021C7A802|nr:astacin-like metalloprotease toxin 2 [Eriocheir sinensis]XP_050728190.1 astacin-like metalloprotease toxin 2 [Eriocheir sinensis]XP_050728191.1 astacin-like metalloprotease toxin 2 [Eriocheir sinensis]